MAAVPTLRACTQDTDPGVGLCEFTVWHHTHTHTAIKNEEKKQTELRGKKKKRKRGKQKKKEKCPTEINVVYNLKVVNVM